MRFAARVEVTLRPGIADPEGATIERALPALGFGEVSGVRAGRSFRFEIEADDEPAARARAAELAHRLLANPVIEESAWSSRRPVPRPVTHPVPGPAPWGRLMAARVGVVVFPGTNCEHDVVAAVESLGGRAELVWHGQEALSGTTPWCCPGASPTATTCGPGPWPASPR